MKYPLATILTWTTTGRIAFKLFDYFDETLNLGPMVIEFIVLIICLLYTNQ